MRKFLFITTKVKGVAVQIGQIVSSLANAGRGPLLGGRGAMRGRGLDTMLSSVPDFTLDCKFDEI